MNFKTESGRSMVEMLGTLAIIGVLSIGGIAGYSYGMDKYRCNQTMRDISLRTVDLITQASQGRAELSLSEWENEDSIYDFSNPAYSDDGLVMFDIGTTKKLPKSVCQMVFEGLSNTAVQIDINESPATSKDNCGDDNTMTFYFEGGGNASASAGTGGGMVEEQCDGTICGMCERCDYIGWSSDPDYGKKKCVTVGDYEAKCTTDDNKTGWCVSGTCESDTTCNCDEGYYCADKNHYGGSCRHTTPSGTCVEARPQFKEVDIEGTTYYISKKTMSWWDAVSACEALGNKKLLSVYDFIGDWDGTGPNSSGDLTQTALSEALYYNGLNDVDGAVWTSTPYNDACNVYYVYPGYSGVYYNQRIDGDGYYSYEYYAVCR